MSLNALRTCASSAAQHAQRAQRPAVIAAQPSLGLLASSALHSATAAVAPRPRALTTMAAAPSGGAVPTPTAASVGAKQWTLANVASGDGRESRLLKYVLENSKKGDPASVLAAIDKFAYASEWLMNVGDVKGDILDAEVDRVAAGGGKVFMELGTYCGYSSVRIAARLPPGGKLYCVEVSPEFARIARAMQEHAGVADRVEILVGDCAAAVASLASLGVASADLVFIDHLKQLYVPDFQRLRAAGLLPKGSTVVADNLVFPGAPDFIQLMESKPDEYDWRPHPTKLEYGLADQADLVGVAIMRT